MPGTVLIIEDNVLNMKLINDMLQANGYDTLQSRNGREALKLAHDHHPNLIIMDIQLPDISGLEVTRRLKENEKLQHIPVIAVTALALPSDKDKFRDAGGVDYFTKPISIFNLMEEVAKQLS